MSSRDDMDDATVRLTTPNKSPLIEDVVGTGEKFIEDIQSSIKGIGVFDSMGVSPNNSYLLSGVPGTGKTHCMKALNNSYNDVAADVDYQKLYSNLLKQNKNLPEGAKGTEKEVRRQATRIYQEGYGMFMFEYRISEQGTAYINIGPKILQKFFNVGMNYAQKGQPTVLVFDEADQLMSKRGGSQSREDDKLLSTLMKNLQDIQDIPNLFTVFMTNFPKSMDSAAIRAGRIDKRYEFELPKLKTRKKLIKSVIRQRNETAGYQVIRKYEVDELAEQTEGFSNADIDQVVKEAIRKRAREITRERDDKIIPAGYVTQKRLLDAIDKHENKFQLKREHIGF